MSSKSIRNGIITLIILALGVKLIFYVLEKFIDISQAGDIGKSLTGMGDLFVYGVAALAIILVPFYLSARSSEKKNAGMNQFAH